MSKNRRYSSGRRTSLVKLVFVGVTMIITPVVVKAADIFYAVGEKDTRGSQLLAVTSVAASRRICAVACAAASGCLGFNWSPARDPKCELLSSLRVVAPETGCDLYVPDGLRRTAVKLAYPCSTCMGSPPAAVVEWEHKCEANAMVVGTASTSAFPDLDYLLCAHLEGLTMKLNIGYTSKDDARGCNTIAPNLLMESVWSDTQYYDPPSSMRCCCRPISSAHKVDTNRCMKAVESYGFFKGVPGPLKLLVCPPHMATQRLFANTSVPAYVLCCLVY